MTNELDKAQQDFSKRVEQLKSKYGEMTYLECIVEVCEEKGVEFDQVKGLLSKSIKDKLQAEAHSLNLLNFKVNTLI